MEQKCIEPNVIRCLLTAKNNSFSNKHKVGAVLIDEKQLVLEISCNMSLSLRNWLCEDKNKNTFNYVSHAEESLIMKMIGNSNLRANAKAIVITDYPCNVCARLIILSGIKNVYVANGYSEAHKTEFFDKYNQPYSTFDIFQQNGIKLYEENPINKGMFDLVESEPEKHTNVTNTQNKRVLVHHIDADGFMSRYIAENYFNIKFDEIYQYNYEKTAEWMQDKDILDIYFVDVTPPIEWVNFAYQHDINIHIFDHHLVVENFKEFSNCNIHYNPEFSGCEICLNYFISQTSEITKLTVDVKWLKYFTSIIGDYDTWRFTRETTKKQQNEVLVIQEYIKALLLNDYNEFEEVMNSIIIENRTELVDSIKNTGANLVKIKENQAKYNFKHLMCVNEQKNNDGNYESDFLDFYFEGYPDYYLQRLIQEKYKDADVRYTGFRVQLDKGIISFSTRSLSSNKFKENSAQALAQKYGGNGHLHAAGFKLSLDDGFKLLKKDKTIIF